MLRAVFAAVSAGLLGLISEATVLEFQLLYLGSLAVFILSDIHDALARPTSLTTLSTLGDDAPR
jgi:hypothetical protein